MGRFETPHFEITIFNLEMWCFSLC